mgnify:CR=1 FL=1
MAERVRSRIEAGVQISGTAQKPVVRLISDPDLPEVEKLSWLVLGHGPEQGGAGEGDFDVEFRFNRCEWTTGDASGGSGGFGAAIRAPALGL